MAHCETTPEQPWVALITDDCTTLGSGGGCGCGVLATVTRVDPAMFATGMLVEITFEESTFACTIGCMDPEFPWYSVRSLAA